MRSAYNIHTKSRVGALMLAAATNHVKPAAGAQPCQFPGLHVRSMKSGRIEHALDLEGI